MAGVLAWIQFVVQILPVLGQILAMIEGLFPNATGAEKKVLATSVAQSLLPSGPEGKSLSPTALSGLIDSQVALLNDVGAFSHK